MVVCRDGSSAVREWYDVHS